jgi:hypothetical protein
MRAMIRLRGCMNWSKGVEIGGYALEVCIDLMYSVDVIRGNQAKEIFSSLKNFSSSGVDILPST